MRFTKYVAALALPLLAVATTTVTVTPGPTPTPIPASQCNPGPIQCCNSLHSASDPSTAVILGLIGIVLEGVDGLVGLACSPISTIGVGGNSCSSIPVCCQNNDFGGVVAIGCVPVNLSL